MSFTPVSKSFVLTSVRDWNFLLGQITDISNNMLGKNFFVDFSVNEEILLPSLPLYGLVLTS